MTQRIIIALLGIVVGFLLGMLWYDAEPDTIATTWWKPPTEDCSVCGENHTPIRIVLADGNESMLCTGSATIDGTTVYANE